MDEPVILALQEQIQRLQSDNATLRAEAKDRRLKAKALREEYDKLTAAYQAIEQERNTYKEAFETEPHELQAQVNEYRGKLRDRDHRDKFRELAQAAGVTAPKAIDDLYQLSGYKPEKDEIDDKQITAAIGQTLQGRDWLKLPAAAAGAANGQPAAAGTAGAQAAAQATLQPGPGASRGGASRQDDTDSLLAAKYPNAYRLA